MVYDDRLKEVQAILEKRLKSEEEILTQAKELHNKNNFEAALKLLEKVMYDKIVEKGVLVTEVSLLF